MAMSGLFDERVEAAAKAAQGAWRRIACTGDDQVVWPSVACAALRAADAVVTEEQVADVLRPLIREHHGADENDSWWVADHAHDYAQAVLALFGEVRSE